MRALVVYESIFGNTQRIAQSITEGLREAGLEVELSEVTEAKPKLERAALLVIGGPIHAWSMTRSSTRQRAHEQAEAAHVEPISRSVGIREFLDELGASSKNIAVATFDTAFNTKWFPTGSAAKPAAKRLERRGYQLIAAPEHFFVVGNEGPLRAGETERARAWAQSLVATLREAAAQAAVQA